MRQQLMPNSNLETGPDRSCLQQILIGAAFFVVEQNKKSKVDFCFQNSKQQHLFQNQEKYYTFWQTEKLQKSAVICPFITHFRNLQHGKTQSYAKFYVHSLQLFFNINNFSYLRNKIGIVADPLGDLYTPLVSIFAILGVS